MNLQEEYKKLNSELKGKISALEIENEHLRSNLKEINDKYESLRDIDSPVKEVSQMKKLVKKNDESLIILKNDNKDLLIQLIKEEILVIILKN